MWGHGSKIRFYFFSNPLKKISLAIIGCFYSFSFLFRLGIGSFHFIRLSKGTLRLN